MEECNCNNILTKDANFNITDFGEIVKQNKGIEYIAIPQYRYILLQKRSIENEDYSINKSNFERLFLETFTEGGFKRLLNRMKYNGWMVRGLFQEVVRTNSSVDSISSLKCYL